MTAHPTVSVCLLAYNHGRILRDTVASVLEQDFEDCEIVLSDDCSTDDTWEILQELAAKDARVRAIQTPRNLGMAANANFAVRNSCAPYIALLHHDDLYARDLLTKWLGVMERHPDVGFVSNGYAIHNSSRRDVHPFSERTDGKWFLEHCLLNTWGCVVRGTAMIRRSAWEAVGGMREQFGMLADVDLWMRLAANNAVGYVPEPLITVRSEQVEGYPEGYRTWSWHRMNLLYAIHAANWSSLHTGSPFRSMLLQMRLRSRVSQHAAYWLAYAIYKRNADMLASCTQGANPHEFAALRTLRRVLALAATPFSRTTP